MKFRFLAVLHNMKLESIKNKGIEIYPGARITNGTLFLEQTLTTLLFRTTVGVHSIDEFENAVYFYIDGEFEEVKSKEEMDVVGQKYTFHFLRQAQMFLHELWLLKDNNVYIREGFLVAYDRKIEEGFTYKASLSEVYSYATDENKSSLFTDSEIAFASSRYSPAEIDDWDEVSFGGKIPQADLLYKAKGSDRFTRAIYFTMGARKSAILPMKILSYCTALECLFTIGTAEITHKTAERVASLLGTSKESKLDLYNTVKDAYKIRSTIVHGQPLRGTDEDLKKISFEIDEILRKLLANENDVFSRKDKDMETYFLDLVFDNSIKGVQENEQTSN